MSARSRSSHPRRNVSAQRSRHGWAVGSLSFFIVTIILLSRLNRGPLFHSNSITEMTPTIIDLNSLQSTSPPSHRLTESDLDRLEIILSSDPTNTSLATAVRRVKLDLFQQW